MPSMHLSDPAVRGRTLNGCWLCASAGVAIVQMLLLAQAWRISHFATLPAGVASAWMVGTLCSGSVNSALRRSSTPPAIAWGGAFLGCAVAWWAWMTAAGFSDAAHPVAGFLARFFPLLLAAFLLGFFSQLWLIQQRGWASVAERAVLLRNSGCLMLGLVIAWRYPHWSGPLGLFALLPLLVLDLIASRLDLRSSQGGLARTLLRQLAEPARWSSLRLQGRAAMVGWWKTDLARRRSALPTLLGSFTAILVGAAWGAVPTPFAGWLAATGELDKLTWLLAGQVVALALFLWLFNRNRGLVGAPDRLIPAREGARAWRLAWLSLGLAACSLVLLGLPPLQAPWWLALSFGLYSLAANGWGALLPRLRPSISTEVFARRYQASGQGALLRSGILAYEQAVENRFRQRLGTAEGLATAALTPVVGLIIDHTTVDRTLIFAGLSLAGFLVIVLAANPRRVAGQVFARARLSQTG